MAVDERLRDELLAMRDEDQRVRAEVVRGTSAFAGYHPRMEEVHGRNAARLKEIIAEHGWPGRSLVGEDGVHAAWLIAQHAIGDPPFQRQALVMLREAASKDEVPTAMVAFLEDRVCMLEGRPQVYGTQFEPGDDGMPRPYAIADAEHVNERRRAVGLNTIEERTRELRVGEQAEYDPAARADYQRRFEEWLKEVGWR